MTISPPPIATFGTRRLSNPELYLNHNAWDHVQFSPEQLQAAQLKVKQHNTLQPQNKQYNTQAHKDWDQFYTKHENKFFKDRAWLENEFRELFHYEKKDKDETYTIAEFGSGAGNTIFPLLRKNQDPNLRVIASDFSSQAIEIIKGHESFDAVRCKAFVYDLTDNELPPQVLPNSVDLIVLIFVFSALHPSKFSAVLSNIYTMLKPGGKLLFRDYGRYDLTQLRFQPKHRLEDNFYARGDGTQVYFLELEELEQLAKNAGFEIEVSGVDRRMIVNRLKKLQMFRVWLQAKFVKPLPL